MTEHFTGLIAPPFTPMLADGAVDLAGIGKHAASLSANGVDGLFLCGSTGESMSLSVGERLEVVAHWKQVVGDAVPVIVHVGHTCVEDARLMAEHAQSVGTDAVAAMGPCFFKPACVADLVEFCAAVAAAAPDLPFYYYNIPQRTGVQADMVEFLRLGLDRIPTLAGIKYSVPNLTELGRCMAFQNGRFNILYGCDDVLLSGWAFGARGSIGTLFNFAAPVFRELVSAFEAGEVERAQQCQRRVTELMGVLGGRGLGALKAIMKMIGVDCGPPRLPLRELLPDEYSALESELGAIGFFDYCSRSGV